MGIEREISLTETYNDMVNFLNLKIQYRDYLLKIVRKINTEITLLKSDALEVRAGIIKEELGEKNYD